ncbi:MAG: hypothetical protein LBB08_01930 [Rickettsiales bacterium]|nr:hypothetical protein [Rickettsiales bacterium]
MSKEVKVFGSWGHAAETAAGMISVSIDKKARIRFTEALYHFCWKNKIIKNAKFAPAARADKSKMHLAQAGI